MQGFMDSALASSIPYWNVQQEIFIHKEHFYYNPLSYLEKNVIGNQSITHYNSEGEIASYLLYSARLPAGARVQVSPKPDYTLDIQNVPPIAHESDAPPEAIANLFRPVLLHALSCRGCLLGGRKQALGEDPWTMPRSPPMH